MGDHYGHLIDTELPDWVNTPFGRLFEKFINEQRYVYLAMNSFHVIASGP
jgi:hypothetical protein